MSAITTHVLDTALGRPAAGIAVVLDRRGDDGTVGRGRPRPDRQRRPAAHAVSRAPIRRTPGVYRLTFDTQRYFESLDVDAFYPEVVVVFETLAGETHYHVPLLLGPFGFTTYRGT